MQAWCSAVRPSTLAVSMSVPREMRLLTSSLSHAAVTEPDPALLPLEVPRLARRLTVLPPLELLRSLHEGGVRPGLERHDQRNITITWTQHCTAHYWVLTGQSRPVP